MKYFLYSLLVLTMISISSCGDNEEVLTGSCKDDFAAFYYGPNEFRTMRTSVDWSVEEDLINPYGVQCGITAELEDNSNLLTIRIGDFLRRVIITVDTSILGEKKPLSSVKYISQTGTYATLISTYDNFLMIDEFNTSEMIIKGKFAFEIETSEGKTLEFTNGIFNCAYTTF